MAWSELCRTQAAVFVFWLSNASQKEEMVWRLLLSEFFFFLQMNQA